MGKYLGEAIPTLGFGMMRLPKNGDKIDIETTKIMVDKFLAAGFTYFDTAWIYEGSEDATRQALVERYPRESFQLATKNAAWVDNKPREAAVAQFETSRKRLGTDYIDFYLATRAPISSRNSACGISLRNRSASAGSGTSDSRSTPPPTSSTRFSRSIPKRSSSSSRSTMPTGITSSSSRV